MISTDASIATRILSNFSAGSVTLLEQALTKNRVALSTTVGTATDTVISAVVSSFNKGEVDVTLVLSTDLKIISDAVVAISKADADQIVVNSVAHRIINVREINPAGTVLAYVIQARI